MNFRIMENSGKLIFKIVGSSSILLLLFDSSEMLDFLRVWVNEGIEVEFQNLFLYYFCFWFCLQPKSVFFVD